MQNSSMSTSQNKTHYLKVCISSVAKTEEDLLSYNLFEAGAFGVSEDLEFEQKDFKYTPEILDKDSKELVAFFDVEFKDKIKEFTFLKPYEFKVLVEKNKDWLLEWKKHFKPFKVLEDLWIVPSWEKPLFQKKDDEICIYIEPGLAFGTGTHATTKLCIKALSSILDIENTIASAIDWGAGSAVLSIFLAKKDIKSIVACEIDELARENATKNLSLNNVDAAYVCAPDDEIMKEPCDLVVANIIDGVLLQIKDQIFNTRPKHLVLSGILNENAEWVKKEFTKDSGYTFVCCDQLDEWSMLQFKKEVSV